MAKNTKIRVMLKNITFTTVSCLYDFNHLHLLALTVLSGKCCLRFFTHSVVSLG